MPKDEPYRFKYEKSEIERLKNQHRVWHYDTQRLWQRAGLREGMTVLDVGCGPGLASLDLARAVGPSGRVIALDMNEESIGLLAEEVRKEKGFAQVQTHVCDLRKPNAIQALEIGPASVDFVFGRWIFMYLQIASIVQVVEGLVGLMRSDGFMAVQEFGNYLSVSMYPNGDLLRPVVEAFHASIDTPEAGIHLPGIVSRCGLTVWDEQEIIKIARPGTDLGSGRTSSSPSTVANFRRKSRSVCRRRRGTGSSTHGRRCTMIRRRFSQLGRPAN